MNKENTYHFIKTKPELSALLLLILTAAMLLWITSLYLPAVLFSLLSFLSLFRTSGFIIDKKNEKVKMVSGYLGVQSGKWYRIPNAKYVSLLRTKQASNSNNGATSVQNSPKSSCYQINLVVQIHREKRPFRLMTTNVENAIIEGKKLGEFMNLKVLDSTTHKRRWI